MVVFVLCRFVTIIIVVLVYLLLATVAFSQRVQYPLAGAAATLCNRLCAPFIMMLQV